MAAVENAKHNRLEPVLFHKNALDVLAHQIAGILMDKETISQSELLKIINRAYPYSTLTVEKLEDVVQFLESLHKLRFEEEGKVLKKTGRTREYYYSNLSMIPDEKRYPVINILNRQKNRHVRRRIHDAACTSWFAFYYAGKSLAHGPN